MSERVNAHPRAGGGGCSRPERRRTGTGGGLQSPRPGAAAFLQVPNDPGVEHVPRHGAVLGCGGRGRHCVHGGLPAPILGQGLLAGSPGGWEEMREGYRGSEGGLRSRSGSFWLLCRGQ